MDAETVKRYRDEAQAHLERRADRTDADQLNIRDMRIFNLCDALLNALGE